MAKIEPKIFEELKKAVSSFGEKYFVGEELNRSKITDDLRNYDEALLSKLFEVEFIKQHFIKEVAGQKLFQIDQLEEEILYNDYWDTSYTKYERRVGLASKGKFIFDNQDVVLDFPFKDAVLTASMTKEERKDGYDDTFLNEIIEKDEIDRLLEKKIFINVKRYGNNLTDNPEDDTVSFNIENDNLIIKGNNLLALNTLKEKEKLFGQVKLIYIDPPYNTGSDSFAYNDKFNHSAWLTFMKNRLEIAKDLLSDDGYIFVQTDDSEQAYLKILMDSVFGREQYINTVAVSFKNIAGAHSIEEKRLSKNIEFLTVYSKNWDSVEPFNDSYSYTPIHELVQTYRDEGRSWKYTSVIIDRGGKKYIGSTVDGSDDEIKIYIREDYKIVSVNWLIKNEGLTEKEVYEKYRDDIFQTEMPMKSSIRPRVMEKYDELINEPNKLISIEYTPKSGRNKGTTYEQFYIGDKFRLFAWLKDTAEEKDGVLVKKDRTGTLWDFVNETKNVNKEGRVEFPNGKKPERLLGKIIEMTTNEGDIVLDFFMGSGSTPATAMKMNRRFIGMEQIDDQWNKAVERLKNVVNGDPSGISTDVNWQGGGSFVYAELFPKNLSYLKDIIHSNTTEELKSVYERMLLGSDSAEPADISYKADLLKIDWSEGFDHNKRILVKLLDKNGLYYNYSEIDDENVRDLISDADYTFNKLFYEGGE